MLKALEELVERLITENEDPNTLCAEDLAYLEQIESPADLGNFQDTGDGKMLALAADAAQALWYSRDEADKLYEQWYEREATRRGETKRIDTELLLQPVETIQKTLAHHHRERTGRIPRGQLWQPCERQDCDNEPVCMNCLRCEDEHCDCFD